MILFGSKGVLMNNRGVETNNKLEELVAKYLKSKFDTNDPKMITKWSVKWRRALRLLMSPIIKAYNPNDLEVVEQHSLPKGRPIVFVAAHSFLNDYTNIVGAIPSSFAPMGNKEGLYSNPIKYGLPLYILGVIPFDRQVDASRVSCKEKSNRVVEFGGNLLFFIEGSHNYDENTLIWEPNYGYISAALDANALIVPVCPFLVPGSDKVKMMIGKAYEPWDVLPDFMGLPTSKAKLKEHYANLIYIEKKYPNLKEEVDIEKKKITSLIYPYINNNTRSRLATLKFSLMESYSNHSFIPSSDLEDESLSKHWNQYLKMHPDILREKRRQMESNGTLRYQWREYVKSLKDECPNWIDEDELAGLRVKPLSWEQILAGMYSKYDEEGNVLENAYVLTYKLLDMDNIYNRVFTSVEEADEFIQSDANLEVIDFVASEGHSQYYKLKNQLK